MKHLLKVIALLSFFVLLAYATNYEPFLDTAVDVAATVTKVNGTDFNSKTPSCKSRDALAITCTFTRVTGSASTLDFEFQASYNNGVTWTTAYLFRIQVPTNTTAVSNVVRYMTLINSSGITNLRLYRIVNNDASVNTTACNVYLSIT